MLLCRTGILRLAAAGACLAGAAAQNAPTVSQVLNSSAVSNRTIPVGSGTVTFEQASPAIYSQTGVRSVLGSGTFVNEITNASNYGVSTAITDLSGAVNSSIATALGLVPISSPASGVILRKDEATGIELPVSSTLGTILTERAETIGRRRFFLGFTHQTFHFTELNGQSLNGLQVLYRGGDVTNLFTPGGQQLTTYPATFNLGLDVRMSQNVAFLTYGVTDRLDVTVGLPQVHTAVSARTYNGRIYAGAGEGLDNPNNPDCWCANTFIPGTSSLIAPEIGSASRGKTGFGDLLLRVKGTVISRPRAAVALGMDLRLPTGDEANYLGTGTTSFKPFVAVSIYTKPIADKVVFAPHFNLGYQYSGESILAGTQQGTVRTANSPQGTLRYVGAPFTSTKANLPDVFSWAVGTEIGFSRRTTIALDVLGNNIGWQNGVPWLETQQASGYNPDVAPGQASQAVTVSGLVRSGTRSVSQYSGSFGFKTRLAGNLIFTYNALVRFDDNILVARYVPLYGLSYTF